VFLSLYAFEKDHLCCSPLLAVRRVSVLRWYKMATLLRENRGFMVDIWLVSDQHFGWNIPEGVVTGSKHPDCR